MSNEIPDITPYRDLRIYDRDLYDIYEVALQDLQSKIPDWVPREDSTEVMLMEAMALEVAEAIFAINRLPGAIMTILLRMYGIELDEGEAPTATVKFTVVDSFGYEIPEGTRLMFTLPGGAAPIVFSTTSALAVPNGEYEVTGQIKADEFTARANNVPAGTYMELLDNVTFVEHAELATEVVGGRDAETDQQWITRGIQRFSRLVDTLAVPRHFVAAALERTEVTRAYAVDLWNPDSGTSQPGEDPGHLSLAVYGAGQPLTTEEKADIKAKFSQRAIANLVLHIIDPVITTVNVSVTVKKFPTFTDQAVEDAITFALAKYLSPETWDWSGTVRINELIALISNVAGVDYVQSITSPSADLNLSGVAPLADFGTATITVV